MLEEFTHLFNVKVLILLVIFAARAVLVMLLVITVDNVVD
jgi:hypothetical protein